MINKSLFCLQSLFITVSVQTLILLFYIFLNKSTAKQIDITHNLLTLNSSDDVIYVNVEQTLVQILGVCVKKQQPGSIVEKKKHFQTGTKKMPSDYSDSNPSTLSIRAPSKKQPVTRLTTFDYCALSGNRSLLLKIGLGDGAG